QAFPGPERSAQEGVGSRRDRLPRRQEAREQVPRELAQAQARQEGQEASDDQALPLLDHQGGPEASGDAGPDDLDSQEQLSSTTPILFSDGPAGLDLRGRPALLLPDRGAAPSRARGLHTRPRRGMVQWPQGPARAPRIAPAPTSE